MASALWVLPIQLAPCVLVPLAPLQVLRRNCTDPNVQFEILSNPEFLAEGTAIEVGQRSGSAEPALKYRGIAAAGFFRL